MKNLHSEQEATSGKTMFQEESSDLPLPSSSCDPHNNKQDKRQQRLQQKEAARVLLSTITDPTVILFADWLRVRGTLRPWVRLWCVLKPGSLILYNSDKDKGSDWVGTLLLSACQVQEHCSKSDGSCFKLSSPTKQPVWATQGPRGEEYGTFVLPLPHSYCIFQAPSDSAGKCWIDALELAIKCTYLMKRSVVSAVDTKAFTSNVAIPLQPPVPTTTQHSPAAGGGASRQGSPVPGQQWDSPRQEDVHSRRSPDQQQQHSVVSAQLDTRLAVFDKEFRSVQHDHTMPLETPKVEAGWSSSKQHPGEEPQTPTRPPSPQSRSPPCKPLRRTHTAGDRAVLLSGPLSAASKDPQEKEKFTTKDNHSRREWRSETVELKEPRSLSPVDSNHVRFSVSAQAKPGVLDTNQEEPPPALMSPTGQSLYRPKTASAPQKRALPINTRSYVKTHALNDSEPISFKPARSDQLTEAKKQLKKADRVTFGGDLERHQNEATQTSLYSEVEAGSSTFDSTSCEPDSSCTLLLFAPSHAPASSDTDVSRTRTGTTNLSHARTASESTRSRSASWMFPENPTYDADASVTESTADYDSLKTNCSRDKTCVYKRDCITPPATQSQSVGEETDKPSLQQSRRSSSDKAGECGTWALNTDQVDEETQTSCWRFEQTTPLSNMAGRTDGPSRRSVRVQTNLDPRTIVGHSKLCQTGSLTTLHCHTKSHPRRGVESVSSGPQRTSDTDTRLRSPERRRRSGRNSRPSVTRQPTDTETRSKSTTRRCDRCARYMHSKTGRGKRIHFQSDDESSQKSKSETSVSTSPTETVDSSVDLNTSDGEQSDSQLSSVKPSESSADSASTSALRSTGFGSVPSTASSVASVSDLSTASQWGSSQDLSESATSDHKDSDTDSISNTSRSLSQSSAINSTSRRRGSPSYFTSKSGRRKTGRLYKKKPDKDTKKSKKAKGGDAGGSGQDAAGSESADIGGSADTGGKKSKKDKKGKKGDKKKKKGEGDEAASEEGGKKHKKHKKKSRDDTGEGMEVKEGQGEEPTSEEGGKKRRKSKSEKEGGKKRKTSKTKGEGGDEATSEEEGKKGKKDKKRKKSKSEDSKDTKDEGGDEATSEEGGKKGKKGKKRKKSKSEDSKDTKEGEAGDTPASEEDGKKGKKGKKRKKSKSEDSKDTKDEGGDEATSEEDGKKGKKGKKRKKSKSEDSKDTKEGEGGDTPASEEDGKKGKKGKKRKKSKSEEDKDTKEGEGGDEGVSDEDGKKKGKGKKDKKKGKDKAKKKKDKKGAEAAEGGYVSDTESTAGESAVSEGGAEDGAAKEGEKKHDEESLGTATGESEVTDSEGGTGDAASHVSEKTDTEKETVGAAAEEKKDTVGTKRGEEAAPAEEGGGGQSKTAETAHKAPAEGEDDQKKVGAGGAVGSVKEEKKKKESVQEKVKVKDEPATKEVKRGSVAEQVKEKGETGRGRSSSMTQEYKEKERRESQTRPVAAEKKPDAKVSIVSKPAGQVTLAKEPAAALAQAAAVASAAQPAVKPLPSRRSPSPAGSASGGSSVKSNDDAAGAERAQTRPVTTEKKAEAKVSVVPKPAGPVAMAKQPPAAQAAAVPSAAPPAVRSLPSSRTPSPAGSVSGGSSVKSCSDDARVSTEKKAETKVSIVPKPAGQVKMAKEPAVAPAQVAQLASAAQPAKQPAPSRRATSPAAPGSGGSSVQSCDDDARGAEGSQALSLITEGKAEAQVSLVPKPAGQITMAKEPAAAPAQTAAVASAAQPDEQPVPSRHTSSPRASASGGSPVKDDGFVASDVEGSAAASRDMQMSDKTGTPKTSTASSAVSSDMKTSSPSGDIEHVEGAPITGKIGDTGLDRPDNYQTSRQYQPEHGYPEASPLCPKCVNILRKQEAKSQPVDKTLNDRPLFVAQRYKLVKAGDPQYIFSSSATKDESSAAKEGRPSTPGGDRPSTPKSESPYAPRDGSAPLPKDERPSTPKDERPSPPKHERPFIPKDERPSTPKDEVQSPRLVSPQQLPGVSQGATPVSQLQQYRPAGLSTKQPSLAELNYALLALQIRKVRAQNQKLELEKASLRMDILVKEEHLNREYGRDKWRQYLRPDQLDMNVALRPASGNGCQSPMPCSAGECNRSHNRGAPVMMLSLPEVTIHATSNPWLVEETSSDQSEESECDCPDCAAMSGRRHSQRKRKRKSRIVKEYSETNVFMSVSANDLPLCCQNDEELVDNYHTRRHTDFTPSAMREELMHRTEGREIPSRYLKGCGLQRRVDYGGKQRGSHREDAWKTGGSRRDRTKRRWSWKIRGIKLGK